MPCLAQRDGRAPGRRTANAPSASACGPCETRRDRRSTSARRTESRSRRYANTRSTKFSRSRGSARRPSSSTGSVGSAPSAPRRRARARRARACRSACRPSPVPCRSWASPSSGRSRSSRSRDQLLDFALRIARQPIGDVVARARHDQAQAARAEALTARPRAAARRGSGASDRAACRNRPPPPGRPAPIRHGGPNVSTRNGSRLWPASNRTGSPSRHAETPIRGRSSLTRSSYYWFACASERSAGRGMHGESAETACRKSRKDSRAPSRSGPAAPAAFACALGVIVLWARARSDLRATRTPGSSSSTPARPSSRS